MIIDSDGNKFNNPKYTNKYAKKLAHKSRKLAKKKKGSNKQRLVAVKIHEKITNSRLEFTHKMISKLINENQVICIESLKVKNMVKNKRLSKGIYDANFGVISRQLKYKADWRGRTISAIDQWFVSSKTRSNCLEKYPNKWSLKIREWLCNECGVNQDRDHNAAKNILREGLKLLVAA